MEDESGREAEIMDITASDKERGVILVPTGLVLSILHFQTDLSAAMVSFVIHHWRGRFRIDLPQLGVHNKTVR